MEYILKLFDTDLLTFNVIENLSDPVLEITWVDESKQDLLPLGMELSNKGLSSWMKNRSIPKNRAYVNAFLAKCGLNANRPMDVISVCKGLSLNDSYWVLEDGFKGTFEKNNLYENRFSRVLAEIAFTGYGSNTRSTFASWPRFYRIREQYEINIRILSGIHYKRSASEMLEKKFRKSLFI